MRKLPPWEAVLTGGIFLFSPLVYAGAKYAIDETKWISVGLGARGSFSAIDQAAPNGKDWKKEFNLDNARLYFNGQIHKYIKFEVNTECIFCNNSSLREFHLLDAIAKFEFTPEFNIWAGRLLVPSDRAEMDGPFYHSTYEFNKTPFYPSDFSVTFGSGGAGVYGRDNGVNIWGNVGPGGKFQYAVGAFSGLRGGPNRSDSLLYGARFAYNFLSLEKNPGYYTSSTYYGKGGDILTLAYAIQYQNNGAGSARNRSDFLGMSTDLLFEKKLPNDGVMTVEGEFKYFDADYKKAAFADANCFCMFNGTAWTATGLYLFPQKIGIGQFQPYVRYTGVNPYGSSYRDEYEAGVNYVIDGHNARVSLFYQYGDIATKGLNYAPGVAGEDVSAIKLALQIQI